jgi:hypothetical protein
MDDSLPKRSKLTTINVRLGITDYVGEQPNTRNLVVVDPVGSARRVDEAHAQIFPIFFAARRTVRHTTGSKCFEGSRGCKVVFSIQIPLF